MFGLHGCCILHVLHFDKECREICKASFSMPLEGRMGGSPLLKKEDLGMRLEAQCEILEGCGVYLEGFRKALWKFSGAFWKALWDLCPLARRAGGD